MISVLHPRISTLASRLRLAEAGQVGQQGLQYKKDRFVGNKILFCECGLNLFLSRRVNNPRTTHYLLP